MCFKQSFNYNQNNINRTGCSHFRIRDDNDYDFDVEYFIKSVEERFKVDFRSIPGWKHLLQRLHVSRNDCKRKIQNTIRRKNEIIDKLYIQNTRPSPFELTDHLARTSAKWRALESENKKRYISLNVKPERMQSYSEELGELGEECSELKVTAHPNTEIFLSDHIIDNPVITDEADTIILSHLPVSICTNQHKLMSPLGSDYEQLSYITPPKNTLGTERLKEWMILKRTSSITNIPKEINIFNNTLEEQVIKFSVTNHTTQIMNIRFKCLTDKFSFKIAKIIPVTPLRLFPGLAAVFKFVFRLSQSMEEFSSMLYFRVGQKVLTKAPNEALCIPVLSKFKYARSVYVSENVSIPPAYPWQIGFENSHPTGYVKVIVDDFSYHLQIYKKKVDFAKESEDTLSVEANAPDTVSLEDRQDDQEVEAHFNTLVSKEEPIREVESVKTIDFISLLVIDIIDLSLEAFVFENTYLELQSHSKLNIPVYFTKGEYVGNHQCYYDFEFSDPETGELFMTKTTIILAEILPHPIHISPDILDMTSSPIIHGFCEDNFVVTNSHRLLPVTIKIKLTTKMKKLFCITPMEALISQKSSVNFKVSLCSRQFSLPKPKKPYDSVHCTFKIVIIGNKSLYENVPPFFYEIIAPCSMEFKKLFNEKFYKEVSESQEDILDEIITNESCIM